MVMQYFIPLTSRDKALKEVRRRLLKDNKNKTKRERWELKSLIKKESSLKGGRHFYIAKLRKEK